MMLLLNLLDQLEAGLTQLLEIYVYLMALIL